jgi:hypothetical protein
VEGNVAIDPGMIARARRHLATGDLILFTGAGFSLGASTPSGRRVATANELKGELWRLAFPSTPDVDPASSLGDVFDVAVSRARNAVRSLLQERLRVAPQTLPDRYGHWFSLPWFRHYTLNIDDLDEAVATHVNLPRDLRSISALREGMPQVSALLSVHLNGRLADAPDVTFSAPQYGQRLARPDPWYQMLVADLLHHPVVFVGTVLEEAGLWQHIELRQQRSREAVELRPPSYLVTPDLPAARAALLKRYNIDWIAATEEEFFDAVFGDAAAEAERGHAVLGQRFHPSRGRVLLRPVGELRQQEPPQDLALFLMGRQPTWADVTDGFAVERQFDSGLTAEVESGDFDVVLLTGTVASGKSTTTMRLALALEATGKSVAVFDGPDSDRSVPRVVSAIKTLAPDVVVIDELDLFGDRVGRLICEIAELPSPPLVVGALRNSRLQSLDLKDELSGLRVLERTVPLLSDTDIDALIDALSRANRLGRMTGMDTDQRRRVFRDLCGRQLLVAMFEATSGESFQQRVRSECEDLGGDARLVYGMAAIATAERFGVQREELTLGLGAITGGMDNEKLNVVQELITRQLLIAADGRLQVRHRWVAEASVEFFQSNGIIGPPLKALTLALAMKADPQTSMHARERRLLRRLLNHDYLQRMTADLAIVRELYALVEDHIAWDYHYWLQRGSLEVETGDLALAENFLNAAVSKAPARDFRVSTEYAYLLLKKASRSPRAPGATDWAETALKDLEHAMAERGVDDEYYFHVYGSQGLAWARRAPLLPEARRALVRRLMDAVDRGYALHNRSTNLKRLAEDLKKEYLSLAVDSGS